MYLSQIDKFVRLKLQTSFVSNSQIALHLGSSFHKATLVSEFPIVMDLLDMLVFQVAVCGAAMYRSDTPPPRCHQPTHDDDHGGSGGGGGAGGAGAGAGDHGGDVSGSL